MDELEYQLRAEQEEQEKKGVQVEANNTATYTDPTDGTVYEWDSEKNGWFPKIDSNFLAAYQASYGYNTAESTNTTGATNETSSSSTDKPNMTTAVAAASQLVEQVAKKDNDKETAPNGEDRKRKAQPEAVEWFELNEAKNTNIYVSGLPLDITLDEFKELMQQKGGIIAMDDEGAPKIKLYTDEEGHLKGDGLCCYLKVESVGLVIQLLHESKYRDKTLHVERAKFWVKGDYNPELKKKKKKGKKKKVNVQEKLLDWRERREHVGPKRMASDKVVVLKHVFDPKEFEEEPTLINDIREDMTTECGKFGTVKKCVIYDRHPEGVVSVSFKEFEGADACVLALNGRWFASRQLLAAHWDGFTQYDVEETTEEREKRLKQWEQFLTTS
ncbi:17S U2 SnRNP complex component HTATSF1-like [Dysidea avara]|uniref:17S U2 SnRNP complex component HTATSF1-like n=1 Tax=Dysidea avara TaxID=196820 RepID=UPI00332AED39